MMKLATEETGPACPACGTLLLRAIYGLPPSELANDPTVKLMGCLIGGEISEWFCPKCDEPSN